MEWTWWMAMGTVRFLSWPSCYSFLHELDSQHSWLPHMTSNFPLFALSLSMPLSSVLIAIATNSDILFNCSTWCFIMAMSGDNHSYCWNSIILIQRRHHVKRVERSNSFQNQLSVLQRHLSHRQNSSSSLFVLREGSWQRILERVVRPIGGYTGTWFSHKFSQAFLYPSP